MLDKPRIQFTLPHLFLLASTVRYVCVSLTMYLHVPRSFTRLEVLVSIPTCKEFNTGRAERLPQLFKYLTTYELYLTFL